MGRFGEAKKAVAIALPALVVWLIGPAAVGVIAFWFVVTVMLILLLAGIFETEGGPDQEKYIALVVASFVSAMVTALLF